MPQVLDIEQAVLLLEIEPPFDKRDIQLARRRMAKRWHPDIAPPGRQHEHERHLKAINEAADQLSSIAEESRGGQGLQERGQGRRGRRAQAPRRGGRPRLRRGAAPARARTRSAQKHDPFGSRVPDHSVVHRYARCLSYPEWGVGSVNGIYFTGGGDDIQQWARVSFQPGIRTVPAGSLQFVDFSKPDPGAERVERFMTAAKHALAEGDFKLAARRLVFARDAQPGNPAVLRLMTLAFWQAGDYSAAARAVRDWIRSEPERPAPYRYAARIYERHGRAVAGGRRRRARDRRRPERRHRPGSASAGCGCAASTARARARRWSAPARPSRPIEGLLDLALVANLLGRRRRRGQRLRAGDACSPRTPRPPGRARARARAHGPDHRLPARPASARWRSPTTPRCATCASRSRGSPRGSCARPSARSGARAPAAGTTSTTISAASGTIATKTAWVAWSRPPAQPRGQQRAEAGDGEAAAHRAEELDRGGGDADLAHVDAVLGRDHERLEHRAHAEADDGQVERDDDPRACPRPAAPAGCSRPARGCCRAIGKTL